MSLAPAAQATCVIAPDGKSISVVTDNGTDEEKNCAVKCQVDTKIGVTQSGGSRYESGREMPKPVRELLRLVHVEQIDLSKVKKEDFDVLDYLKNDQPELYKKLRRSVRAKQEGVKEEVAQV